MKWRSTVDGSGFVGARAGCLLLGLLLLFAKTPAGIGAESTNSIRLNLRGVSLKDALDYFSDAVGLTVICEAQPKGQFDIFSAQPVSQDEAMDLLNQALLRNGYAAIRKGRNLTIVARDEAKTKALPVKLGADPESIPRSSEMVTQIVPVKFVEASQLLPVLQPLASSHSTMTANESANTVVITDTEENIHRLVEVIHGIDTGAEDFTLVKVFHLRNSNSSEMAELITELFPEDTRSESGTSGAVFAGFPGGGGGGGPGGFGGGGPPGFLGGPPGSASAAAGSGAQTKRLSKRAKVTAVADQRTQALVVTASRDLMLQIEEVVVRLDENPKGRQNLAVFELKNASPNAIVKVLQDAFQKNGTSTSRNSDTQTDALETRSTAQNQANANRTGTTGFGAGAGAGRTGGAGGLGGGGGGP